ncbi:MAG: hypothetical protein K1060chlam2_00655, partial [Chlamydiae bacterium]|nr:hypothetical protein [Chlamydiota bacterium]
PNGGKAQSNTALKLLTVSIVRFALLGGALVAIRKYGYSKEGVSALGAVVSLPATLLGWGGKYLFKGLQTIYQNIFVARSFKGFGKGALIYLAGFVILELSSNVSFRGEGGPLDGVMLGITGSGELKDWI